jgi:vesicular inhibitory amino acid transporter
MNIRIYVILIIKIFCNKRSYFISFGTILFCFGGAVMFPTIQTDMINPEQFSYSVIMAYIGEFFFFTSCFLYGSFKFESLHY